MSQTPLSNSSALAKVSVISVSSPLAPSIRDEVEEFFLKSADISLSYLIDPYHAHGSGEFLFSSDAPSDRWQAMRRYLEGPEEPPLALIARGGSGAHELLHLGFRAEVEEALHSKKAICGFSDFTVLLLALYGIEGLTLIHGPSLLGFRAEVPSLARSKNLDSLLRLFEGHRELISREELTMISGKTGSVVVAPLVGGNLSVLCSMVGTPFLPDFSSKLLVVEDVGEAPHKVYRNLCHLAAAGLLDNLQGVILGDFSKCRHLQGKRPDCMEVFQHFFARWSFPVYSTDVFGHGMRNRALPIGKDVQCSPEGVSLVNPL